MAVAVRALERFIGRYLPPGAIALFCVISAVGLIGTQLPRLFLLDDAGYGDSYVLHDVQQFQATGVIYRDLSRPPYTLSSYSPLVYMFYSLPGRTASSQNPFLKPRLMAIAAFLLCIVAAASIAQALVPGPFGWIWAGLLATTINSMADWVLQLRGDLPGVFFSLTAIRLLLVGSPWAVLLGGIAAGLATQFKFTFLAALAAGVLWLSIRRQWKDVLLFTAGGFVSSIGLYVLFWLREPRMLQHLLLLRINFIDPAGCLRMISAVAGEPVVLLAMLAIPPVFLRFTTGRALVCTFALVSFVIAAATDLHPGGNINYFFECLFAVVPLAAIGVTKLLQISRRNVSLALFVVALFIGQFSREKWPAFHAVINDARSGFHVVASENASFRLVQHALQGQHIFSTIERLALLDPAPALVNSFSFWTIQHPQLIYNRLRAEEFDVVLTLPVAEKYRGVPHIAPGLHKAISSAYVPHCFVGRMMVHLPRNRPANNGFVEKLNQIGCEAIPPSALGSLAW